MTTRPRPRMTPAEALLWVGLIGSPVAALAGCSLATRVVHGWALVPPILGGVFSTVVFIGVLVLLLHRIATANQAVQAARRRAAGEQFSGSPGCIGD